MMWCGCPVREKEGQVLEEVLKQGKRSYDGCFGDVLQYHGDLMIAFEQIYAGKKLAGLLFV
jgi:hypothetical protein